MHKRTHYSPYGYKRAGSTWIPLPNVAHGGIDVMPSFEDGRMDYRMECAYCNIANHGFICHFSDGSCLLSIQEEGGPDYGVGLTGASYVSETD